MSCDEKPLNPSDKTDEGNTDQPIFEDQLPQFTAVASFYDKLMTGVPYEEWVRYLRKLIRKLDTNVHTVLDLACGTGNVSEILYDQGFEVQGVDISPEMIKVAREKAQNKHFSIPYHIQDAAELSLEKHDFDLCVSLFDSLNYILDPNKMQNVMNRVFDHLRNGGLFIFDMNSMYALENGFFDQQNLYEDDPVRYVWRSEFNPDTRICRIRMHFIVNDGSGEKEFRETHIQYAYREEEVREMLLKAGFRELQTFHRYTFKPVNPITDRIFYASRKPK
jgi:ubiquinone/menaquinone biosynthesis C-methylase UbiE